MKFGIKSSNILYHPRHCNITAAALTNIITSYVFVGVIGLLPIRTASPTLQNTRSVVTKEEILQYHNENIFIHWYLSYRNLFCLYYKYF